ncbi:MAG TPA: prolipoprotein diacylglyceryl transferase [Terriglobales bacterium]|nr:prolipoprotein diacylglyceryl transferase [Terriglobales bacterium]
MFPRLFHLGSFNLPTYGFMAALGLIFGLMLIVKLGREQGLDPDKLWNLGIIAILSGIIGAKLLYFVTDADARQNIFSLATLQAGGVWSGGVVLALIMCIWYMRRNRLPVLRTCDVFAPGIALGHAFGRVGCFAAGCCYGRETHVPWAVTFHNQLAHEIVGTPLGIPLHPTQLYEMVLELCNAAFLVWLIRRKSFEGEIIGTYMIIYGIGRFFIEFFRGDPGRGVFLGWMSGTQAIAIGLVIFGGLLWMRRATLAPPVAVKAAR